MVEAGDRITDGTVYAGELPNGKKIFAAPEDIKGHCNRSLAMTLNEAIKYARKLNESNYLGYSDWHLPTKDQLNILYTNSNKGSLANTFNKTDTNGWYWSSTITEDYVPTVKCQRFSNGDQRAAMDSGRLFVRLVRG